MLRRLNSQHISVATLEAALRDVIDEYTRFDGRIKARHGLFVLAGIAVRIPERIKALHYNPFFAHALTALPFLTLLDVGPVPRS